MYNVFSGESTLKDGSNDCQHNALSSRAQVASLILEVQRVHARLGTLSDFKYRMSEEDIRLSWRTMDYPTVRFFVLITLPKVDCMASFRDLIGTQPAPPP